MARIVADTDVLISALAGREPAFSRIADALEAQSVATTTVTVLELLSGAKEEAGRDRIRGLLGAMDVLPVDTGAAERASDLRRTLERSGTPIGFADCLIAGICLSRSMALMTGNRRHFERVPGLKLVNLDQG